MTKLFSGQRICSILGMSNSLDHQPPQTSGCTVHIPESRTQNLVSGVTPVRFFVLFFPLENTMPWFSISLQTLAGGGRWAGMAFCINFSPLPPKVWLRACRISITSELVRNAACWAAPQTYPIKICILRRSMGVSGCLWASLVAQLVKNPPAMWETWVRSLVEDWEDSLEKGKATHFSILAWRIPWTV